MCAGAVTPALYRVKTRLIPSSQAFRLRLNIIVASLLLAVSIAVYYVSSPPAVHGGSPGSVVVNKYQNSGTTNDILELLVVQNNLDMRGMIVKDFSADMANDGGGKYEFTTNVLWSAVRAGTLIVLRNDASAADTTTTSAS